MPDTVPGLTWGTCTTGRWVTVTRDEYAQIRESADSHVVEKIWDAERGALFYIWERDDEPGVPAFGFESVGCVYGRPGTHTYLRFIPDGSEEANDG